MHQRDRAYNRRIDAMHCKPAERVNVAYMHRKPHANMRDKYALRVVCALQILHTHTHTPAFKGENHERGWILRFLSNACFGHKRGYIRLF